MVSSIGWRQPERRAKAESLEWALAPGSPPKPGSAPYPPHPVQSRAKEIHSVWPHEEDDRAPVTFSPDLSRVPVVRFMHSYEISQVFLPDIV